MKNKKFSIKKVKPTGRYQAFHKQALRKLHYTAGYAPFLFRIIIILQLNEI